jgi:short-subunit dehydrogenase
MRPLTDRVVLLTGASRGLGVDMARAFAAEGARLALAARSTDELEKVRAGLEETGGTAIAVPTDVNEIESLRALVRKTTDRLGPIDVLVNNAGVEYVFDFEDTPLERIDQILDTNLKAVVHLTRLVAPSMVERGSGHICNISSVAGFTPVPHNSVYSASKHALVGFTRSLRMELAEHGVEVSVVCPGFVEGGMFLAWGRPAPKTAGSVTSAQVASAVIDAVKNNRGKVVVAKGLAKMADAFFALMPKTSAKMMRRSGTADFLTEQARINAEKR